MAGAVCGGPSINCRIRTSGRHVSGSSFDRQTRTQHRCKWRGVHDCFYSCALIKIAWRHAVLFKLIPCSCCCCCCCCVGVGTAAKNITRTRRVTDLSSDPERFDCYSTCVDSHSKPQLDDMLITMYDYRLQRNEFILAPVCVCVWLLFMMRH